MINRTSVAGKSLRSVLCKTRGVTFKSLVFFSVFPGNYSRIENLSKTRERSAVGLTDCGRLVTCILVLPRKSRLSTSLPLKYG